MSTHQVCNIKCKSSLHWNPLSIQTNTKYKSLQSNMQGRPILYILHYTLDKNRSWRVFVRCYRERVKRAKCPPCVRWTTLMCGCLHQPSSTTAAARWAMNGDQQQGRFCCKIWPKTSKMGQNAAPVATRCKKRPWFSVFIMTTTFKLGTCTYCCCDFPRLRDWCCAGGNIAKVLG